MFRVIILKCLLFPLFVSAQYQIKGSISRPDGSAIRSIAAVVKKQGHANHTNFLITDSLGSFTFQVADTGSYELKLQSLFYQDTIINFFITTNDKNKNIGAIMLQPLSQTLKTVLVTAKKPIIEFKDDHISFNPSADPSIGSRPVTDFLNRIPGISIDAKNNITAKGQEGVQLLVNGRIIRSAAGDYLVQLNADEVDRIELYDNATRFAYIKAPIIINVILKSKQPKRLWNAALNTNTLPKLNPSADASFSVGKKQRIYARISHDVANFRSKGYITRSLDSFQFYQSFNNRVQHQMSTARLGWDYYPDSSSTLTIEGNYTRHTDGLNAHISVKSTSDQFQNIISSYPVEKEINGFITYRKDQKQKGHKMLEISYTQFNLQNERNLPGLSLTEQRDMNNYSVGFKAEWQKKINDLKFLNGVSGQRVKITDHIDTVSMIRQLKSEFYNNSITSYHEIQWQWKKWNVAVGANIDYVQMNLNRIQKEAFIYQNFFINPSVKINKIKGITRTSLSYNRKYILPSTHILFGQYSQYEYGRTAPGNYSLKPAVQDLIKLSFSTAKKAAMLFEFYYDVTQNPVVMLNRIDGSVILERPENLKTRKSIGAVFSISYPVRPYYSFTLNMDGRINDHEFRENIYTLHPQTWSGSSALINRFTVNKKLSFSLNAALHNWRTTLYRDMNSFITYAIQGSYKINPRLNMSFSVHDIFNNMKFSYSGTIAPRYYENSFSTNQMRNISLSLRYQLINSQFDKKTTTVKSFLSE